MVVGVVIVACVFRLLPTRWWVVDGGALIVSALFIASGVTLLRSMPIAERLTRIAAGIVLALGLALVTAIFATAGWISGVYGQVGAGGAVVFALVGAMVLPYVVALPVAELAWLGPPEPKAAAEPKAEAASEPEPEPESVTPSSTATPKKRKKTR